MLTAIPWVRPMPIAPSKALFLTGVALMLAACNTTGDRLAASTARDTLPPPTEVTGSIGSVRAAEKPKVAEAKPAPVLPGDEPATGGNNGAAGAIAEGRAAYRANHFREAERLFHRATQLDPRSSEAWIGLAASADRLRDFAQADRAYSKAREIAGPTAEVLNNQGYSYMLRGDMKRARDSLNAAQRLDPANTYVANNLALLASNEGKTRR
ncbi:tetratricopeptide repeat protein [Undibacter mobilis]|uniref:Tetratricopeptide repeat protein n=1 Tax=Undibacter mobilis TaxID=2292256 RepID=A0A371B8W1_9BRAD|nr:tetratricopeptide repeat protein [Undibacter mobilis]RDV03972.1 tetratricopeptide repeat protein [Undibacter mobilis]